MVFWVLAGCAVVLVVGTVVRLAVWLRAQQGPGRERLRSMGTWWVLYVALALGVLGGPPAAVILLAVLSLLGIWEYDQLTRAAVGATWTGAAMFGVAVVHYVALYLGAVSVAQVGTPLAILLLLLALAVFHDRTAGFLRATAIPLWGWMLIVYCPSHAVLVAISGSERSAGHPMGPFLFLMLLTELHDIAQALWGRRFGRRKITPKISPGKTWEGLLLGTATTVCLAAVLSPLVFLPSEPVDGPIPWQLAPVLAAACAGLVIAVSGFLGDISMSAVKRDCGVKDSGRLLPGQGGILDRIDSLTLAAPAFYYYTLTLARYTGA